MNHVLRLSPLSFLLLALAFFSISRNPMFARSAASQFVATLSGGNEIPANGSRGSGGIIATLNGTSLSISGLFDNLGSEVHKIAGAVSLHMGLAGENGSMTLELVPSMNPDSRGGTFDPSKNTFELTGEQITALMERRIYLEIRTLGIPGGEVRGQLVPDGGTYFHAHLSGRAEIFPVEPNRTEAIGGAILELRTDTLIVSGAFSGLESDLATTVGGGVHLRIGAADTNGPGAFALSVTPGADSRSGSLEASANTFKLTSEQLTALSQGKMYINVHSLNHTEGEVRGQVVAEEEIVFEAFLAPINETQQVLSLGSGGVVAILQGNQLKVAGSFKNLTSEPATAGGTGIELIIGEVGKDGDIIYNLTPTLESDTRSGRFRVENNTFSLLPEEQEALLNGQIYVNIHSLDNLDGELRGQLLPSTNLPPTASALLTPPNGSTIVIPTNLAGSLSASWESSTDPNGNQVHYLWQVSNTADFSDLVVTAPFDATSTVVPFIIVQNLLDNFGVDIGPEGLIVYHRVITTDGSLWTTGEIGTILFKRQSLGVEDEKTFGGLYDAEVYPNPGRDRTRIQFSLADPSEVGVELFDQTGKIVRKIPSRMIEAGAAREVELDLSDLVSGLYTYRLTATTGSGKEVANGQITVVK